MSSYTKIAILSIVSTVLACAALFAASILVGPGANGQIDLMPDQVALSSVDGAEGAVENESGNMAGTAAETEKYPMGWVIADTDGIPALSAVEVFYAPSLDTPARKGGELFADNARALPQNKDEATVIYEGKSHQVNSDCLLLNLPDLLDATYDIRYAYDSSSKIGDIEIEGVTGKALDGYSSKVVSPYTEKEQYVVPVAYKTALKLRRAAEELEGQGLRLVVWDAYRPVRASQQLSDALEATANNNDKARNVLSQWGMSWYVANGASGHNFASDIDVSVERIDGEGIEMPSAFDEFDSSAHLTVFPMAAGDVTEDAYAETVKGNDACMSLHRAMKGAGFSELASEWWHFSDDEGRAAVEALAGGDGLDFVAEL